MPNQIMTLRDTLFSGIAAGFTSFMQFIPALLGAIVVLVIGWLISGAVARLLERVLYTVRFENVVSRIGVSGPFQQAFGPDFTATHVMGLLAKWFIRLIFIQAAANIIGMPQVTAIINNIILYIPNIFVALIIMVVGGLCAQGLGKFVEASVSRTGISRPGLFSLIARYGIIGLAAIAAVNQLGIATNLLNILFTSLVGSVALALGLAFGLGGQEVAHDLTRNWYERSKGGGAQLKPVSSPVRARDKEA